MLYDQFFFVTDMWLNFLPQYLVDIHCYIDELEQANAQLHTDIHLALTQLQNVSQQEAAVEKEQAEEILRLQQSEAMLARQVALNSAPLFSISVISYRPLLQSRVKGVPRTLLSCSD